jgi:hypothetical protein
LEPSTNAPLAKFWPPTKGVKLSIVWAVGFGFPLQIVLPFALNALGAKHAALLATLPGLLSILWATGGWFAGITPVGYAVMFCINTVVYSMFLLAGFRLCVWLRRQYE